MAVWSQIQSPVAAGLAYTFCCTPAQSVTQKAPLQLQLSLVALYTCYAFIYNLLPFAYLLNA